MSLKYWYAASTQRYMHLQVVLDVLHDPGGNLSIIQEPQQYDPRTRRRKHPDCSGSQSG